MGYCLILLDKIVKDIWLNKVKKTNEIGKKFIKKFKFLKIILKICFCNVPGSSPGTGLSFFGVIVTDHFP